MEFGIQVEQERMFEDSYGFENRYNRIQLHDWQRRAKKFFFENKCSVAYSVVTGAGKTFFSADLIKDIYKIDPNIKTLVVVPKNVILEQTWFPSFLEHGFTLREVGVYYGQFKELGSKITITNMQSVLNLDYRQFDCICLDELHNYNTGRLIELMEHPFKYKIGLSATIEKEDGSHWKLLRYFNYNQFKYDAKDAIEDNIINRFKFTNYEIILDSATMEKYRELTDKINFMCQMYKLNLATLFKTKNTEEKLKVIKVIDERKKLIKNYPAKRDLLKQLIEQHPDERIMVFGSYNKEINDIRWELLEIGIHARCVHSDIPKEVNEETLSDFKKNNFKVLLSVDTLSEGYNLPAVGVCIIMSGNSTNRQAIQRMGRVLRKKDTLSDIYQVYCKDTFEDTQAQKRTLIMKNLADEYDRKVY